MSATNVTTHYSLPQYVATDHPKYLTDFNETMLAIDNQMYTNATAAATADGKAVAAQNTADANTSSIGTLNVQINGDPEDPTDLGLAGDVSAVEGNVNTINSLIGNGTPTTTDKTIIGAINELNGNVGDLSTLSTTDKSSVVAAINELTGGSGAISASAVSYDNQTSGLTADDVQEAIDEIAAAIPGAAAVELQKGTLAAGSTSVVLTFASQTIGADTLIDIYTDDYDVAPTAVATTSTTVTLTFESQAAAVNVAVRVQN